MPFTPVPPNDPSLVRLLNSDVRCRQWVDSVMQRLTLKERIGQLFIYTIAPRQDKANKELLRKVVEDYKVGGLLFSGGLMQNQVMLTNEAQRMAEVPLMITFDGEVNGDWLCAFAVPRTFRETWCWAAYRTIH